MGDVPDSPWFPGAGANRLAAVRLFCFPYAGGSASVFRHWSSAMPPTIELCPVQLPGREHRSAHPPLTTVPAVVDELASGLQPFLDRPFVLFGHSLGAVIAFELVRELRRRARSLPSHLFASACASPETIHPAGPARPLSDDEVLEELRRYHLTPPDVLESRFFRRHALPYIRADFHLWDSYLYRPEPPLPCPITAVVAREDTVVRPDSMAGWPAQTTASFTSLAFDGDHFSILESSPPLVRSVVEACARAAASPAPRLDA
jgi:medium-chain acyl-[acyl-carrier-protein] hydrolase